MAEQDFDAVVLPTLYQAQMATLGARIGGLPDAVRVRLHRAFDRVRRDLHLSE